MGSLLGVKRVGSNFMRTHTHVVKDVVVSRCEWTGYRFTRQLRELELRSEGASSRVLQGAEEIVTPLVWQQCGIGTGRTPRQSVGRGILTAARARLC